MATSTSARIIPVDQSINYWDRYCDPRTVNFWLMSNGPWKLAGFTIAYLAIIVFGQRWMRKRKPYVLRTPMLIYNITMVIINGYFLYESLLWLNFGQRLFDFKFPSINDRSSNTMHIINMFYYYQWTKFVDYFDTFFFILRKKDRQLTALHIYHHISVPIIGWISSWVCLLKFFFKTSKIKTNEYFFLFLFKSKKKNHRQIQQCLYLVYLQC